MQGSQTQRESFIDGRASQSKSFTMLQSNAKKGDEEVDLDPNDDSSSPGEQSSENLNKSIKKRVGKFKASQFPADFDTYFKSLIKQVNNNRNKSGLKPNKGPASVHQVGHSQAKLSFQNRRNDSPSKYTQRTTENT